MKELPVKRRAPRILASSVVVLLGLLSSQPGRADQFWNGPNTGVSNIPNGQGGTGTWDNVTTNWTNAAGTTSAVYDPTQNSVFATTAGTVTLGDNITIKNLSFTVDGYVINDGGFSISASSPSSLTASTGVTATINAVISSGALSIDGLGTIVLAGNNTYAGGTTLSNGALSVNSNTALGTGTLTITNTGGIPLLTSGVSGTTIANSISIPNNVAGFFVGSAGDFTLNGTINLNGGTPEITSVINTAQIHFGGIGAVGETGGVTFDTIFTTTGQYTAFILDLGNANHYTGLTTVGNGAFLVFEGNTADGAIHGDIVIQGNGVVDYLGGNSSQISDGAVVEVDSGGNTAGGVVFAGLDLFNSSGDTIGTLQGSASGTIGLAAATLSIGSGDYSGSISDGSHGITGGGITKIGTGILVLRGANSYTGNTNVDGGALVITGSLTGGHVLVNNGAEFAVASDGLVNLPAAAAAVTVNNTGGIVQNAGAIVGGAVGVSVAGTGSTTSNLTGGTINAVTAVDLSTAPTGNNTVANFGTLTGTGGTAVNGVGSVGTLKVVNAGVINGNVAFGAGDDTMVVSTGSVLNGTANGAAGSNTLNLVGTGTDKTDLVKYINFSTLNKLGGGTWTITGNHTFTGGTTIGGGTLIIPGNLTSNVQIQTQGTLAGTGMITGNVTNAGTLSPGNGGDAGNFTVKGNYFQTKGGTLLVKIGGLSPGQSDHLTVQGQATLDGNLRLQKTGGLSRLKVGEKVQFLTATSGVSGHFTDVENPFDTGTMIRSSIVYDANGVSLEGTQGSYAQIRELTPNQVTVARNIDRAVDDPRAKKVVDFLNQEQLNKIPQDLDRIAPEELASVYRIGFSIADVHAQNLQRRTADIRAGSSGFSASGFQTSGSGPNYSGPMGAHGATGTEAAGKSTVVQAPPDDKWGVFITGTGDFVNVGDSENARGYNMETGGMAVGVDYKVTPHLAVGVTAGYASTSADLANDGRARVVGAKGGVYGTYSQGRFYVDAAVNGGYNSYDTNRSALKGTARGNTDGGEFDAMIGTGYDFKFGDLTIGPTATLQYTYVGIDGFTERGSLAPLAYGDQNADSFRSALGFRTSYDWQVGGVVVRPEIRAAWQHEFGDRGYSIDSRFASGAGDIFSVTDTEIGRDSLLLGAGVAVLWNPRTSTYIYYDGDVGRKDFDSHNVSGGMRLSF